MTIQSKDDLQRVELEIQSEDPSFAFAKAEEFMEALQQDGMGFGNDDVSLHFVSTSLPRIVIGLLKRGDLDQDVEERAYQFLRSTLIFVARFLETGVDELVVILEHVFDQHTKPFYVNSSGDLHEEISNLTAPRERDAFEDEEKMHEAVFAELGGNGRTRKGGGEHQVEGRFISNINVFGRWNGFRRIRDAIVQQQRTPFRVKKIHYLLNPLYKVKDYLTTEFIDWFMEIFPKTTAMILDLSDDELKAEAAKINEIVDILCAMYRLTSHMDSPETVDKFRLDLALKGLRSTILERRLTGLGDINDFVEMFARQQTLAGQVQDVQPGGAAQEHMCDWLMSNKILDEIFVRNVHAEVLKRSIKVLLFLATNRRLGELEVKMIWDASLGQHESISKMIHELLSKTASQLNTPDVLLRMLKLIRQQPVPSLTSQHIFLAKRIATILVQLGTRRQMHIEDQFAGIELLWRLMQDETRLGSVELQNMCITSFTQLIALSECRVVRAEYFEKCVKNLVEHKSALQSLVVMNGLFYSLASKRKKPDVDWSTFGCLKDEQELLSLIVDDLVQYRISLSATEGADSRGNTPRSASAVSTPRGLKVRWQDQIAKRLEFITSILQLQGTSMSTEHLNALWATLVQPGIDEKHRDFSFKWLQSLLDNQWTREAMMSRIENLFQLECSLEPVSISKCAFELFRKTLLLVNCKNGMLVCDGPDRNAIVTTREKLPGTDFLWQISLYANIVTVADQAISMLNDIYQGVSSNVPNYCAVLQERRQEHVAACLHHMLAAEESLKNGGPADRTREEIRISRCICILRKFLHDFEQRTSAQHPEFSIRKHGRQLLGSHILLKLQQFGQTSGEAVVMPVDRGATLRVLRELAGRTLGEDPGSLRMIAKGKELKGEQKAIADFRLCDGDTVHWTKKCGGAHTSAENDDRVEAGADASPRVLPHEFRTPHDILSQEFFEKIFDLLDTLPRISMQVWDLLMVLPTNQRLKDRIRALGPSLPSTLCHPGVFTQLYTLQIVEILLFEDNETNSNPSWKANFIASGGVTHLLQMILSQRFSKQESDQCNDCLAKLLNLLFITMIEGPWGSRDVPGHSCVCAIDSFFKDSTQIEAFVHMLLDAVRVSAAAANVRSDGLEGVEMVAKNAMRLLVACILNSARMSACICTVENFREWLAETTIRTQSVGVRQIVCQGIMKLACQEKQDWHAPQVSERGSGPHPDSTPLAFFFEHLLSLVCDVNPGTSTCNDFFDLVNQLVQWTGDLLGNIRKSSAVPQWLLSLEAQYDKTAMDLIACIKGSGILEERQIKQEDVVLHGHLRILSSVCALRPQLKADIGRRATEGHPNGCGMVEYLTEDCLFRLPSVDKYEEKGPPKCKQARTRTAAFELLYTLADSCDTNQRELLTILLRQHNRREYRPLHMYNPWHLDQAPSGFVGLRNLGATCYMNSLLQQLFFVPECRSDMLQVKVEQDKDSFLYQLQLLFVHLQESEKQYYDPWDLCQVYTGCDGKPVNISQQMDVDEFLNVLFEKVEQGVKSMPQKDMLRKCFGGKIVHQIICKEPVTVGGREFTVQDPYKSEREETFYTLQLEVKHKRSILESLRLYVDGEVLEGDNQYMCEGANKKVDAVKRICIKELPQTLILHLKRFEFDLDFMKKVKVNDLCEFPLTLDMDPFTLDGIERREKAAADAIQSGLDTIKEEVESNVDAQYELVGVLVHAGTADSGHYYSYIKERAVWQPSICDEKQARWHLFNDTNVEHFNSEELGAACFGGSDYVEEPDPSDASRLLTKFIPRAYNAYMLFYERRSAKGPNTGLVVDGKGKVKAPASKNVVDIVTEENIRFLRDKHTYDPEYFLFLKKVCRMPLEPELDDVTTMLAHRVLMDCIVHSCDTEQVAEWVEIIKTKLLQNGDQMKRSMWVLDAFTESQEVDGRVFAQHWFKKALLSHRVQDCRASIVQLLMQAIKVLVPLETRNGSVPYCAVEESGDPKEGVMQDVQSEGSHSSDSRNNHARECRVSFFPQPVGTVGKFISNVLDMLPEVVHYWRHYGEYFQLLSSFASLGVEEKRFLLARRTISRCIEHVILSESLATATQERNNLGHQFPAPDLDHVLSLISALARSVTLEQDALNGNVEPGPSQMCDAGPLDPVCRAFLESNGFLVKVLSDAINPSKTIKLLEHMSWNNSKQSAAILDVIFRVLDEANEDDLEFLFKVLERLVAMKDTFQEVRAHRVACLLIMQVEKVLYFDTCARCLECLESLVLHSVYIRDAVFRTIVSPRREQQLQPRWFLHCLIRGEIEKVQAAWERVARAVALPEVVLNRSQQQQQQQQQQQKQQQQGKSHERMVLHVQGDEFTKALFEYLVNQDDKLVRMGCTDQRETGWGLYPLRYYFKLISFVIENAEDSWYGDRFQQCFRFFHDVLRRLNENENETDYAKAELLRLMLLASENRPALLDVYTDPRSSFKQTLVSNFILVRPHRLNITFNRHNLPSFYRLLLVCSRHSMSFMEHVLEANEFLWAITHFMWKSNKYPETSAVLLELIDEIFSSNLQPDKVAGFRIRVSDCLVSIRDPSTSPENIVDLCNRFLLDLLGDTEGLSKILGSHVLDALFAAVGVCQVQHVNAGQGARTSPKNRSFKVALQAIDLTNKVLDAVSTAAVNSRLKMQLEAALKDAFSRSKTIAIDYRHKALSAIVFVVLQAEELTEPQRLMTLKVVETLCALDVECSNAAADSLLRIYEEKKPSSADDNVLSRLQHAAEWHEQRRARASGAPAANAKDVEGAVLSKVLSNARARIERSMSMQVESHRPVDSPDGAIADQGSSAGARGGAQKGDRV